MSTFTEKCASADSEIVVIGTSLGGLNALEILLPGLPSRFPLPVVVVQHRSRSSKGDLCEYLQPHSALPVREPQDKDPIVSGCVYLAPADYHLLVGQDGFVLSIDPPVCHARPSIDVLFDSAADTYGAGVVSVILTGANHDGAEGARRVKDQGGVVLVQDPAGAQSPIMPMAAIQATQVDAILPLAEISQHIVSLARADRSKVTLGLG
jgi:two-component system chemotaxis response regulator CheB